MPISYKSLAGSAKWQRTAIITSTQAWVAPADVSTIDVLLIGAGGAGGSASNSNQYAAGGGGGGAYVSASLNVVPLSSYTVSIGAGGAAAAIGGDGALGGTSSFGSLLTAIGGGGGTWYAGPRASAHGANAGGMGIQATYYAHASAGAGAGGNSSSRNGTDGPLPLVTPGKYGYASTEGSANYRQISGAGINGLAGGGGGGYASNQGEAIVGRISYGNSGGGNGAVSGYEPYSLAGAGSTNTGGGGGGGAYGGGIGGYQVGGNGGSGLCIIKYWSAL